MTIVNGDTGKVWNREIGAIFIKVCIDLRQQLTLDGFLNLFDDLWDQSSLNEWNENTSDFADKTSGELDVNMFWINVNIDFWNSNFGSKVFDSMSFLSANISFKINPNISHFDVSFTMDCKDKLVLEISV